MNNFNVMLMIAVILVFTAMPAQSQLAVSSSQGGPGGYCIAVPLAAFVGLVASGALNYCLNYASEYARVGDSFGVVTVFSGPAITGATFTITIPTINGCTAGAITAPTAGIIGTTGIATARFLVTTTGRTCSGTLQWNTIIAGASTPIFLGFNAHTMEQTIESWPTLVATVTNSGTINVINSGTQHTIIDSWPTLVSTVTNSGTITVVNTGGQTMTLTGTVGLTGGITVTNSGGQSFVITSWPELVATICTKENPCYHNVTGNTTVAVMGNVSVNQTNLPPTPQKGFDGSLYVLLMFIGLCLGFLGEISRDNVYRYIAGFIFLIDAFIGVMEAERLGFTHPVMKFGFCIFTLMFAAYFLIPKSKKQEATQ